MAHRKSRFDAVRRENYTCLDAVHLSLGSIPARRVLYLQQQGAKHPVEHSEYQQIALHLSFNSVTVRRFERKRP